MSVVLSWALTGIIIALVTLTLLKLADIVCDWLDNFLDNNDWL